MSTYVCSDIHGNYDLFMKALDEIQFNNNDELYILGDMIDKGNQVIKLLEYIVQHNNIHCIIGNHEQFFLNYYRNIMNDYNGDNKDEILDRANEYFSEDESHITWEIINYLDDLPYYIEHKKFIGVHAGMKPDGRGILKNVDEQDINTLLYDRYFRLNDYINPFKKPILFGHTSCFYDNDDGRFIKTPNIDSKNILDYTKIQLDTGVEYLNMIGILRIDDMKEFYVKI